VDDIETEYRAILCLKALMNNNDGLMAVLNDENGINTIVLGLWLPHPKLRIAILELIAAVW